jgi:hypothetical protein
MSIDQTALWSPGEHFRAAAPPAAPPVLRPQNGRGVSAPGGVRGRRGPGAPLGRGPAASPRERAPAAPAPETLVAEELEVAQPGPGAPGGRSRRPSGPRHRVRGRRPKPGKPALSQPTGPHVRLGILWAAATLGALLLGLGWLTAWLAVVAAMAAGSAARSWGTATVTQRHGHTRRGRVQPPAAVAAAFAALITVAAMAGGLVMAVVAATFAVVLVALATFGPLGQPGALRRVVIVLGPGLAAGSLVLARSQGLAEGLVLAGMVTVFDSSNYLIGTGAPNRWEGSVAGAASIAALTLFVAAVLVPPFTGASPWLLGIAVAVLAPAGPVVARWVIGDPLAPVPALRRLDSLFLAGPMWAGGVALLLHK